MLNSSSLRTAPIFSHPAPWRSAPLQYFPTPLRCASQRYRTFPLCSSSALRAASIISHPASILSTRSNIFRHRFTAPRAARILSYFAPRRFVQLQYSPTPLLGASTRSNILLPHSAALRAALIFSHADPWRQISLRSLLSRKIPLGVSYTVHPVNFTPAFIKLFELFTVVIHIIETIFCRTKASTQLYNFLNTSTNFSNLNSFKPTVAVVTSLLRNSQQGAAGRVGTVKTTTGWAVYLSARDNNYSHLRSSV